MQISIIAAMTENRVIGINNELPWHLPADLARFKALTLNKPIIMGRKTYESIGRPLPKRHNIIISRKGYSAENCDVFPTIDAALRFCEQNKFKEVFIIGGASIYETCLPLANTLYLTYVKTKIDRGDVFFPEWDDSKWQRTEETSYPSDNNHAYGMSFVTFKREKS